MWLSHHGQALIVRVDDTTRWQSSWGFSWQWNIDLVSSYESSRYKTEKGWSGVNKTTCSPELLIIVQSMTMLQMSKLNASFCVIFCSLFSSIWCIFALALWSWLLFLRWEEPTKISAVNILFVQSKCYNCLLLSLPTLGPQLIDISTIWELCILCTFIVAMEK